MASNRRSAYMTGLVLAVILLFGLAWVSRGRGNAATPAALAGTTDVPGGGGTLDIPRIEVTNPMNSESQAEGQATAAWSESEFPGIYRCVFIARDEAGREVGRHSDIVASLSPSASFPVSVDATAPAASMDGECGSRLDTGTPYRYDISSIRVTSGQQAGNGEPSATVEYDASWAGDGQAGAVACTITVTDGGGAIVGSSDTTLFVLEGAQQGLTSSIPVEGAPATAAFDCSPFSG